MHDMNLEKYRSKIQTAYKASPFTKGIFPEPEEDVYKRQVQERLNGWQRSEL